MIKDLLSDGALTHFATAGLVIFVTVFLGTCVWILTRSKRQVNDWARLPLAGDTDAPVEDRQAPSNPQR